MQVISCGQKLSSMYWKEATSKLISNDAIQMSHFIHMNYEAEGDNRDLEKMGRTEYLLYKQQFQEVLPRLDSLIGHCSPGISDYATPAKSPVALRMFPGWRGCQATKRIKRSFGTSIYQGRSFIPTCRSEEKTKRTATSERIVSVTRHRLFG